MYMDAIRGEVASAVLLLGSRFSQSLMNKPQEAPKILPGSIQVPTLDQGLGWAL